MCGYVLLKIVIICKFNTLRREYPYTNANILKINFTPKHYGKIPTYNIHEGFWIHILSWHVS